MPENPSEKKMSVLCEASWLVREIASPATGKAALLRAYRRLGTWTYSRVKDVYYADRRVRISADEIDALRAIASARSLRKTEATGDPSIAELRDQLALVVLHLQRIDPSFHHPLVEALGRAAHSDCGREDRVCRADGEAEEG